MNLAPLRSRVFSSFCIFLFLAALQSATGCPSTPNPTFQHEDLPPDLDSKQGTVGLATRQSLLTGPRARGRVGDWVLRNNRIVAVFRRQDGKLLDFGLRKNGRNVFAGLTNTVSDTRGTYSVQYSQARTVRITLKGPAIPGQKAEESSSGRRARLTVDGIEFFGRVRDRDLNLDVQTRVWALPDEPVLVVRTTVRNASRLKVIRVGIGDQSYFGNVPLFVPGHGTVTRSAFMHADWVAQETRERTLALVTAEHRPMALRFKVYSKGFHPGLQATYGYADMARNDRFTVTRYLVLNPSGLADTTALVQGLLGGPFCRTTLVRPKLPLKGPRPVRVQVERAERPLLNALVSSSSQTIVLSAGPMARARLWLAGAGPGPWTNVLCSGTTAPSFPTFAILRYRVVDATTMQALPTKIVLRGLDGSPQPDFGSLDRLSGTANMAYSLRGEGELLMAPGKYLAIALHGPEYTWDVRKLDLSPGTLASITFKLQRVLDTKGAVSADLHLHAAPSSDSELSLATRLGQLAATGVEVAVATDHNAVTDYRPAVRAAGLTGRMFVLSGVEATTKRSLLGHFNLFPLAPGSPTPPYENRNAKAFFAAWHGLSGRPILQVNHPRLSYLGYFNQMDFDPKLGTSYAPGFSMDFDAIEVFNGTRMHNPQRIEDVFADWFALLNLGRKITGTGNSDSHKLVYQEAGYPRTYLVTGVDSPANVTAAMVKQALRSHRVVAGSGPYLTVTGNGKSLVGSQVRSPLKALLTIQAPCWLTANRLALVANGRVIRRWSLDTGRAKMICSGPCGTDGPGRWTGNRERLIGLENPAPRPMTPGPCRTQRVRIPLVLSPKRDTWYLLLAWSTMDNPTMAEPGGIVLSFTNPVWVDADGDGKFAPALLHPYPLR